MRRDGWLGALALSVAALAGRSQSSRAAAGAAATEAPIFYSPLLVGHPFREEPGGHALLAARGSVLWVAAAEGLRRYDLEHGSLSRPAGLPAARATAVVAGPREIWAAVEGRLYRSDDGRSFQAANRDRSWKEISYLAADGADLWLVADGKLIRRAPDGQLFPVDLHKPDTFSEVVAVASAAGGVCWASAYWYRRHADAGAHATTHHTALLRVRGGAVEAFPHPEPGRYLAAHALIAQPDGSVLVGFVAHRGDPIGDRYFHRFDGKTWTPTGGWTNPWRLQPDRTLRFTQGTGAPIEWQLAAGDGRFWIAADHRTLGAIPADPGHDKLPFPAEAGELLGVADTPRGLMVLGEMRLARWNSGRWTVLAAPDARGVSREKLAPKRPGFYAPTGFVLRAGDGETPVARGVEADRLPARKPLDVVDGVPLAAGFPPMWMDGLRNGLDEDLTVLLPDLDPRDRFRFVGLAAGDALRGENSETPYVHLTRSLPKGVGLLLSVEAVPTFRPEPKPGEHSVRFEPRKTIALVKSGQPMFDAAARFQRKNVAALNQALAAMGGPSLTPDIQHPRILYDAERERLLVCTSEGKVDVTSELCYVFRPDRVDQIESLLGSVMENPR